jgi:biotin transporter BioY
VSLTPAPARFIDPRGQRLGAGVSTMALAAAFLAGLPWLVALIGLNLLVSAAFGTRLFLPGRAWPLVRKTLRLGRAEPEHEYPPRFAQALGGTFLALATLAFLVGAPVAGWLLTAAVAGLQALLAITGICVGCRLYFLRWWVPSLVARLFRRTDRLVPLEVPAINRVR